jgi:hypothetical protein
MDSATVSNMKQLERSPTVATSPVKFTAVNVTPAARDSLRLAAVTVSAAVGRRVSMSDALLVIAALASAHPDEMRTCADRVLNTDPGEGTPA